MPARERLREPLAVWRLLSRRHTVHAFDGEGARLYGGRWNHPGTAVVYASLTLSLAALEVFVHVDPEIMPPDLVALRAELPAGLVIHRLTAADLPAGWRAYPAPEALQDLGTGWLEEASAVALAVPSAVIPQEEILLLNPAHPAFAELRRDEPVPFAFDPRMWKG